MRLRSHAAKKQWTLLRVGTVNTAARPQASSDNVTSGPLRRPATYLTGLIEDVAEGGAVEGALGVHSSWMADAISNYNSDLYYQPRDYLRECYLANEILAA